MTFSIGNTSDDPRKIKKSYHAVSSFSGTLKNDCSTSQPIILVECNISTIARCNYMYIPSFGFYYYVDAIKSVSNKLCEIQGHKDVLMSNADDILSSPIIAKRSQSNYDLYLDDANFKVKSNPKIVTHKFPNAIPCTAAKSCFLLMCAGSAVRSE